MTTLSDQLKQLTRTNPLDVRAALSDPTVLDALSLIGVLPKVLELHAPALTARKPTGLGDTLCGIRGTRHGDVTCLRCLKKLGA